MGIGITLASLSKDFPKSVFANTLELSEYVTFKSIQGYNSDESTATIYKNE